MVCAWGYFQRALAWFHTEGLPESQDLGCLPSTQEPEGVRPPKLDWTCLRKMGSLWGTSPHVEDPESCSLRGSLSSHLLNNPVAKNRRPDIVLPFRDAISGSIWLLSKPSSCSSERHRLHPGSRCPVTCSFSWFLPDIPIMTPENNKTPTLAKKKKGIDKCQDLGSVNWWCREDRAGPWGSVQGVVDGVKIHGKEPPNPRPEKSQKVLYTFSFV